MLRDLIGSNNTHELIEEINLFYEKIVQLLKELRTWNEFFNSFKLPQFNFKHTEQRISTNCLHYFSNYVLICIILLCLQLIMSPILIIILPFVFLICFYIIVIYKKPISFGKFIISDSMKRTFCIVLALFLLTICNMLERLIWYSIYCIIICGLHMLTRPRSVTSKTNKVYQELKLNGFSWFSSDKSILNSLGKDNNNNMIDPENPSVVNNHTIDSTIKDGYSSSIGNFDPTINMRKRGTYGMYNNISTTTSTMNNKND